MTIENDDAVNSSNLDDILSFYTIGVAPITDTILTTLTTLPNNKYSIPVKMAVEGPEYTLKYTLDISQEEDNYRAVVTTTGDIIVESSLTAVISTSLSTLARAISPLPFFPTKVIAAISGTVAVALNSDKISDLTDAAYDAISYAEVNNVIITDPNTGNQVKIDNQKQEAKVTTPDLLTEPQQQSILQNITPLTKPTPSTNYSIKSGDTLSNIADENGTTVEALMELNPYITDPNLINAGDNLLLKAAVDAEVKSVNINGDEYNATSGDLSSLNDNKLLSEGESLDITVVEGEDGSVTSFIKEEEITTSDGTTTTSSTLVSMFSKGQEAVQSFLDNHYVSNPGKGSNTISSSASNNKMPDEKAYDDTMCFFFATNLRIIVV